MVHPEDFGGNMARPSNSLGPYFTPSFPTPANIDAQAPGQAPFQPNGSGPFISGAGMPWSGHPSAYAPAPAPPAPVAPQAYQPQWHPCWTMPPAAGAVPNAGPFQQHFGVAAARPPVHGEELSARGGGAAVNINILASQPFQPNSYTHGWPQPMPPPQAPPAPLYPALQPGDSTVWGVPLPPPPPPPPPPKDAHFHQWPTVDVAPNGNIAALPPIGATGWAPPMAPHHGSGWPPTSWAQQPGGEMSWGVPPVQQPGGGGGQAPPVQQPCGQMGWAPPTPMPQQPAAGGQQAMSWAPPAPAQQQPGGGGTSWAAAPEQQQQPGVLAATPASGSAQAQPPAPAPVKFKTFEEFLVEAGILDERAIDRMLLDDLRKDLMGDDGPGESGSGPGEPDGPMVSLGGILGLLPPSAADSSSSGPSRDQVGLSMARAQEEEEQPAPAASAVAGSWRDRDATAAAEARARRGRRMAKRKEATSRARPGN